MQLVRVASLAAALGAVGDLKPLRHRPCFCLSDGHCPQACRSRRFSDIVVKAGCGHSSGTRSPEIMQNKTTTCRMRQGRSNRNSPRPPLSVRTCESRSFGVRAIGSRSRPTRGSRVRPCDPPTTSLQGQKKLIDLRFRRVWRIEIMTAMSQPALRNSHLAEKTTPRAGGQSLRSLENAARCIRKKPWSELKPLA